MGVKSGSGVLYHLTNLTAEDVTAGYRGFFNDRREEGLDMDHPTIWGPYQPKLDFG